MTPGDSPPGGSRCRSLATRPGRARRAKYLPPRGMRNGVAGTIRPRTLLSFEGASRRQGHDLDTDALLRPEPAGVSGKAGRQGEGPGTLRTT